MSRFRASRQLDACVIKKVFITWSCLISSQYYGAAEPSKKTRARAAAIYDPTVCLAAEVSELRSQYAADGTNVLDVSGFVWTCARQLTTTFRKGLRKACTNMVL